MKASLKRRRASRGETLVETMVSMAIFTIALLGILEMNILARGQLSAAGKETKAANLARDLTEGFERLPFSNAAFSVGTTHHLNDADLKNDSGNVPLLGAANAIAAADLPADTDVSWTCTADNDASGAAQGVTVDIAVTFKSLASQSKTLHFFAYKYDVATVVGGANGTPEI